MAIRRPAFLPVSAIARPNNTGLVWTVAGLKPASTANLYANGSQIATTTVDGTGKATWNLGSAPAAGTIMTYDGTVTGSAGIAAVPQLIISGSIGPPAVGDTTSFTPTISGGTAPYTVTATGLPPGRSITNAASGLTTGAYTTAGSYNATYTVTDSGSPQQTASFMRSVTVSAASGAAAPSHWYNYNTTRLSAAKAGMSAVKAGTGRLSVPVMGDSTTAGIGAGVNGASTSSTDGAFDKCATAKFVAALKTAGLEATHAEWGRHAIVKAAGYTDAQAVKAYNPRVDYADWMPADSYSQVASGTGTFTYTPTVAVDTFEFLYLGTGAATWTYKIGGAAPASVSPVTSFQDTRRVLIKAASASTAALTIQKASGDGFFYGVRAWNSAVPGVDVLNYGVIAIQAAQIKNSTGTFGYLDQIIATGAKLVFLNYGENDMLYAGNPTADASTYGDNVENYVSYLKTAGINPVIVFPPRRADVPSSTFDTFLVQAKRAAVNQGVVLLDLYTYFGANAPTTNPSYYFDSVHMTEAGYAVIGGLYADFVSKLSTDYAASDGAYGGSGSGGGSGGGTPPPSGTRPWTETDLVSGTALVWDATVPTTFGSSTAPADGASITNWTSKDGSTVATAPASDRKPTYQSAGLNGKPCLNVVFPQKLVVPALAQGPTWAMIVVHQPGSTSGTQSVVDSDDGSFRIAQYLRISGGNQQSIPFDTGGTPYTNSIPTTATAQIAGLNRSATSEVAQINGGSTNTTTISGTGKSGTKALSFGNNLADGQQLTGKIAYIGMVPTASITQDELDKWTGKVAWQFGLQNLLPAGHPYKSAAPTVAQ